MNNELADELDASRVEPYTSEHLVGKAAAMIRQQQAEIEALKNANRFIQNFAEEQHQRAVALEMRELTDEEIAEVFDNTFKVRDFDDAFLKFAKAILRKASEK
jgi:lipoate-protein ligase A